MEVDDQEDFHRLRNMSVPKQKELVTEQALYDAGLSSVLRLGIVQYNWLVILDFLSAC